MSGKPPSLVGKCLTAVRRDGFGPFCRKVAGRLERDLLVTNAADWYRADLCERPAAAAGSAEATFRLDATEEVIAWLTELSGAFGWAYVQEEVDAARTWGHLFGLLRVEGQRAGYIKVGLSQAYVTDFERCIAVPHGSAYIYDTFVHPEHRGRSLAQLMIAQALEGLRGREIRWAWCHIPPWNVASIKSFTKNGFKRIKRIRYLRLLGWPLYSCQPGKLLARAAGSVPAGQPL